MKLIVTIIASLVLVLSNVLMPVASAAEKSPPKPVPFSSFFLLDSRDDISKELFSAYWRDVHGVLVSQYDIPDMNYWQLHLEEVDLLIWPEADGVNRMPEPNERIEGIAAANFSGKEIDDKTANERNDKIAKQVFHDEQNVFKASYGLYSKGKNAITFIDKRTNDSLKENETLFKTMVLLRKADNVKLDDFRAYLRDQLAPKLSADRRAITVRLSLLEPYDASSWDTPGVENNFGVGKGYHAVLELVFKTRDAVVAALRSSSLTNVVSNQSSFINAAFVYPVNETFIMISDGRATQLGLRGHPTMKTIEAIGANNQKRLDILQLIYGAKTKLPRR